MIKFLAFSILLAISFKPLAEDNKPVEMIVYRSASCGCCAKWIEHVKQHQFKVKSVISDDMQAIKEKYAIPEKLASCHTAVVEGYIIEGHVPADDIRNLLAKKPNIAGIAAPGMPLGSPGMEVDGQQQAYRVISFDKDNKFEVFAEHEDSK